MKSKKMSAWLLALCLGVPFLAACGGGGGGGGGGGSARPTVNGSVSATDYEEVANGVVDTLTATFAASEVAGSYSVGGASQPSNDAIVSLVRQGVARLRAGERAQPLAINSETLACSNAGGSLTVTVSYKDPNTVSAGDYVDFQARDCVDANANVRIDGGLRLTVTSATQQSFEAQLSARRLSVTANDVETVIDGVATVAASTNASKSG